MSCFCTTNHRSFAMTFGGGLDVLILARFSLRTSVSFNNLHKVMDRRGIFVVIFRMKSRHSPACQPNRSFATAKRISAHFKRNSTPLFSTTSNMPFLQVLFLISIRLYPGGLKPNVRRNSILLPAVEHRQGLGSYHLWLGPAILGEHAMNGWRRTIPSQGTERARATNYV